LTDLDFQIVRGGRLLDIAGHSADPKDILIEGDSIREIGEPGMAAPDGAREVDAARRLIMSGLINAHTHGHGSLAKGLGDRWTLELLLNAGPWISGSRSLDDLHLSARLNAAEMIRKGCTAAYDLYAEFPLPTAEGMAAVARAYAEVGMRAVVAPMMADRLFFEAIPGLMDALPSGLRKRVEQVKAAPYRESLAAARAMIHGWSFDRSRVRPALAPTIPLHCSDDFITACGDLAADEDIGLHMHLAESKIQAVSGIKRYGKTLTAHLDELGFLGPHFTGAHSVWLDSDDIKRMADNGASVAHNPGSNLRLGSGVAPVRDMLVAGLNVGIGTDGSNCSDNQNMFDATRIASFASRIRTPDYTAWLSTEEVLMAATVGSARTLGMDGEIGRIEVGYKADMLFLDLDNINFVPFNDPTNQIVHSEDSSAVSSVMVGGRMLLDEGRFTTFDYGKLMTDVEAAVERLRGATAEMRELSLALEDHVGHYCVGLARQPYHIQHGLGW
jgi:guanine deaminase